MLDDKDERKSLVTDKVKGMDKIEKPVTAKKKPKPNISKLNKYAQYDKYHPLNQPFPAIENFKGPKSTLSLSKSRENQQIYLEY